MQPGDLDVAGGVADPATHHGGVAEAGAVVVSQPSKWGNPFRAVREDGRWLVRDDNGVEYDAFANTRRAAVERAVGLFYDDAFYWLGGRLDEDAVRAELAGRDLACWCPPGEPCHADVLLEIANRS